MRDSSPLPFQVLLQQAREENKNLKTSLVEAKSLLKSSYGYVLAHEHEHFTTALLDRIELATGIPSRHIKQSSPSKGTNKT